MERGEEDTAVVLLNRCKSYKPSDTVSEEAVSAAIPDVAQRAPRDELGPL